jgi:hypothetical protein
MIKDVIIHDSEAQRMSALVGFIASHEVLKEPESGRRLEVAENWT